MFITPVFFFFLSEKNLSFFVIRPLPSLSCFCALFYRDWALWDGENRFIVNWNGTGFIFFFPLWERWFFTGIPFISFSPRWLQKGNSRKKKSVMVTVICAFSYISRWRALFPEFETEKNAHLNRQIFFVYESYHHTLPNTVFKFRWKVVSRIFLYRVSGEFNLHRFVVITGKFHLLSRTLK